MKIQRLIKYLIDRLMAAIALLLTSPLLLLTAIIIYLRMGRPIIFSQIRAGKDGRPFTIYKFRTMTDDRDEAGNLLPDEERLISLGRLLRRLKIDELLQLWNVLQGDISFVGPRPTISQQVADYDDFQRRRLNVLPGITGWAQVHGNIQLTWPERIFLDLWYIDHWSVRLDLVILIKTVGVVIWGEHPVAKKLEEAKSYANCARRSC
ncbi:MAG: sugar transferase [Xenococcaceae cyanobacterium MO_188.B19]|nr:sugar transferase [Xenococcaceae cyanobacterium MO_188.B19]